VWKESKKRRPQIVPESSNQAGARGWERLYSVVGSIFVWGDTVETEADLDSEEREAAYLLKNAGQLVAALRTLDNRWHEIMEELYLFDSSWPPERRDHVISRIRNFTGQEIILPIVRQTVAELRNQLGTLHVLGLSDLADQSAELLKCGDTILAAVDRSSATPFPDATKLTRFLTNVKNARTPAEVESVKQDLEEALGVFDRRILASADHAFGELRGEVTSRYPSIPDPGWVVSLDDIRRPNA
jgi:hypothetical protein